LTINGGNFWFRETEMKKIALAACVALAFGCAMSANVAQAAGAKGIRFWNLASITIAKLYLAPAGSNQYGANQCENDRDGTVSPDERLKITKIEPGSYDVKLADSKGRVCIVKNIKVEADKVFSIEDKDLTNCNK
jgi:hypothetical protein